MKRYLGQVLMLLAILFALLFAGMMFPFPGSGSTMEPGIQNEMKSDLPVMVLGKKESLMMKNHLIDTGKEEHAKGYWYYIRTYDAGRAQPPGVDEYYQLKVHMIYVPVIATGFNIGLEYVLEEGKTDEWGNSEVRKIIQYHLDDADEDLMPNSMVIGYIETHYGLLVKQEYERVDAYMEWRYWVYFWYSTFLREGMK
jgi:hypothetical protein